MSDPTVLPIDNALSAVSQSPGTRLTKTRELVVFDFWDSLIRDGHMFHIQLGALSTPVAGTAALTALIGVGVIDNNVGYVMIPTRAEIHVATYTTATLQQSMLEADMAKKRYSSGGNRSHPHATCAGTRPSASTVRPTTTPARSSLPRPAPLPTASKWPARCTPRTHRHRHRRGPGAIHLQRPHCERAVHDRPSALVVHHGSATPRPTPSSASSNSPSSPRTSSTSRCRFTPTAVPVATPPNSFAR